MILSVNVQLAGLKAARVRGRIGGRPRVDQRKLQQAIALYYSKRMSVRKIQEATGISRATLYSEIKKRANLLR